MFKINVLIVFLYVMAAIAYVATCGTNGTFCGRGPNRVDCCSGYHCNIAADDSFAFCTPDCGKAGQFCGRGLTRKDCCPGYYCNIAPDDSYAYCKKSNKPIN